MLGHPLIHLMPQILVFGLRLASIVHFFGAIEFSQHVPGLDFGTARNKLGERHIAALTFDLRNPDGQSVDGLHGPV
jgi:hypothetical protein